MQHGSIAGARVGQYICSYTNKLAVYWLLHPRTEDLSNDTHDLYDRGTRFESRWVHDSEVTDFPQTLPGSIAVLRHYGSLPQTLQFIAYLPFSIV